MAVMAIHLSRLEQAVGEAHERWSLARQQKAARDRQLTELKAQRAIAAREAKARALIPGAAAVATEPADTVDAQIAALESEEQDARVALDKAEAAFQAELVQYIPSVVQRQSEATEAVLGAFGELGQKAAKVYSNGLTGAMRAHTEAKAELESLTARVKGDAAQIQRMTLRSHQRSTRRCAEPTEVLGYLVYKMLEFSRLHSLGLDELWASLGIEMRTGSALYATPLEGAEVYALRDGHLPL